MAEERPRIRIYAPMPRPETEDPVVIYEDQEAELLPPPDPDDPFVVFLISPRDLHLPERRRQLAEPFVRSSDPRSAEMTIVFEDPEPLTQGDVTALRELASEAQVERVDVHVSSDR